jgi:predicted acyltransferase
MGFFQMNLENYSHQAMLPRSIWEIVITVAFFLIWLDYSPRLQQSKKWLQILGVLMLVFAAIVYQGETNGQLVWMQPHWWGILGLIGWAYFACATLLLFGGEKLVFLIAAFACFLVINASARLHAPAGLWSFDQLLARLGLGDGSNSSITMAGVIISVLYRKWQDKPMRYTGVFLAIAAAFFLGGFMSRPLWGISKIRATPSWTLICNGISLLAFCVLIYIVDRRGKKQWFQLIKPAGTSTLTCYLLPYLHGAIFLSLLGLRLPEGIRTGWIGIAKSLLFALAIVLVTGLLEKKRLRLKI